MRLTEMPPRPPAPQPRQRRLRTTVGWFAVTACALAALSYTARASVGELALDAGAEMMRYADADQRDAQRTLVLNGLRLHVGSGGTRRAPRDVLDAFHARCRERSVRFDARLPDDPGANAHTAKLRTLPLDGVLRLDDGERGYVACLDLGGRRLSPNELLDRTRRFLAGGDLAEFGDLRVVFVERHGTRTNYLALWTDGPLPLWRAFAADGDVPGKDPDGVPRPAGLRRVLSAWQADAAPTLTAYRADATSVPELRARYQRFLESQGFRVEALASEAHALVASRGERWVLLTFVADGSGVVASVTPL